MDEHKLIDECLAGKSIFQQKLFEMFAPKMLGVCLRYMKSTQEAEDMLQDGFVKVFGKLSDFERTGSLEGWIRRIMVNTCLDQIRKNAKFANSADLKDVEFKLENQNFMLENLAAQDLMTMINEMPQGYKVVFNMFAIEGYSHKEIGDLLGISENTSKSQYSRARAFLREKLELQDVERTR